jgi:lysophospholipase L1-like esterase
MPGWKTLPPPLADNIPAYPPVELIDMATPPTVTIGSAGNTSAITNSVLVRFDDSRLRICGAKLEEFGGQFAGLAGAFIVTDPLGVGPLVDRYPTRLKNTPAKDLPAGSNGFPGIVNVEFEHDGQAFEIIANSGGGGRFRVLVDYLDGKGWQREPDANWNARNVTGSSTVSAGGPWYAHKVDFGSRAVRRIRVEMTGSLFGGIRIGPTDGLWAPSWPKGPRVIAVGDSFTGGTVVGFGSGAAGMPVAWHQVMGRMLGWRDVWPSGVGSTGYLNDGTQGQNFQWKITLNGTYTSGSYKITGRAPDATAYVQTAAIDVNATAAQVQTALEAIYGAGNVLVTGGGNGAGGFTVELVGAHAARTAELPTAQTATAMVGGTGWGAFGQRAGGSRVRFSRRIANDIVPYCDKNTVVVWAGGINDGTLYSAAGGAAAFRAEVDACLQAVAATGAKQVVLGPWNPTGTQAASASSIGMRDALQAAAAAVAATFIDTLSWITGTGKVGSTNGSGNSDVYTSSDGTHPPRDGHGYLGRRAAAALRAAAPSWLTLVR